VQLRVGVQFVRFAALCTGGLALACASATVPEGTVAELRALRELATEAERVDEAVAISQALVDRELSRLAASPATMASREAVARAWVDLATAQVAAYERASARASYLRAIEVVEAAGAPPEDPVDSRAYTQLALLDRTDPTALAHASKAVGILERRYDGKHLDIVRARLGIANALWAMSSIVDGHAEFVRALSDARALVGENHELTAEVYFRLAQVSESLQRTEEAEELYEASIAVFARIEAAGTAIHREKRSEVHEAFSNLYKRERRTDDAKAQRALAAEYSSWTHKQVQTKTVNPIYPPHAKQKRVTGWVEVVFTISKAGATEDVHIVEATRDGVFDRAAVWAVEHWRYLPGERNGAPDTQRGVRVRLQFTDKN
jgi:TonB family protein